MANTSLSLRRPIAPRYIRSADTRGSRGGATTDTRGNRGIAVILSVLAVLLPAANSLCAEKPMIHRGITVALPKECSVKLRWVCPPLDDKVVEESKWYYVNFTVDNSGRPWIGHDLSQIMSPTQQYQYSVDKFFDNMVYLDNGALILSTTTHIGSPMPPKDKEFDYRGLPRASFQPIAQMPFANCRLFAGASNCLYLVGHNPATEQKEVYLLRPEKGSLRQYARVFTSKDSIASVTGDGERTYIATDRVVLKVLTTGAVSKVYVHPTQTISGLAYDAQIGLFYATDTGVGFVGANGSVDLLAAQEPRICLRQGALYVFLPKSYGVLALDNVKDLKRFNLAFKDVPATKSAEVKVTGIRFFEGGEPAPEPEARSFALKFDRASTRYVYCQVDMDNLLYEKRAHKQALAVEFLAPGQEWGEPANWTVDFTTDIAGVWSWARIGADEPGTLYPGEHTAKIYLNGSKIDERKFTIEGDATVLEAAYFKDTARLKSLLAKGGDPNEIGEDGRTPLMWAAWNNSIEDAGLLLARKADVNIRSRDGDTALRLACSQDDAEGMVQLLLSHGADTGTRDEDGKTVLHNAVFYAKPELIRLLLEHGADPNARDNDGETVLRNMNLIYSDPTLAPKLESVELLLKHGADPDARNEYHETPLFDCCRSGNVEAARLLIEYKADVNAVRKGTEGLSDTSLLGHAIMEYGWEQDPGIRDRMRVVIRLLSASGAQLLPGETSLALAKSIDGLLDRSVIKACLEKDDQLVFSYTPEDPALRGVVLERLMRIAFSAIASANSADGFSKALNLCLDARAKADMWGLLAKYPEISFDCGLLWVRTGNPSNARMYLEEYLRLAPEGSAASKAGELLRS